ncbi:hypothetical protein PS723_03514 [Pseudomonas fluorescens]|uniref:Uncharacterized protein n=1 Tax=Pseudomonas fluorescens TaxID=294 RepID=A0A5E7D4M4_PSEFL|nr:hypothetical protein PS723_03514 [Pseudomonas fluorescens]
MLWRVPKALLAWRTNAKRPMHCIGRFKQARWGGELLPESINLFQGDAVTDGQGQVLLRHKRIKRNQAMAASAGSAGSSIGRAS